MDDIKNWTAYSAELRSEGYGPGVPSKNCMEDRDIVESDPCEHCGGKRSFRPFIKWMDGAPRVSYRAYSVCEQCNTAHEF